MKKLLLLLVLLIAPITVFAAATPNVLTVSPTADGATINYTGTTEDGVYAAACKLYAPDAASVDDYLDAFSSSVDANKFEGTLTAPKAGKYLVKCANYDGGDIVSAEVEVTEVAKNQPKTGDNIVLFVILGVVALAGIAFTTVKLVKKSK